MLRKAPLCATATNLDKSTVGAVVWSCWEHALEKPKANSGFVEAGGGKSITSAGQPLVIHTDKILCVSCYKGQMFICLRTLVCKNKLTALLPDVWVLSSFKIWCWRTKEKGHASVPAANPASEVCVFSKPCAHIRQEFDL